MALNLGKIAGTVGETIGKAVKSVPQAARSVAKSTPGKILATTGAVGAGTLVVGAGVGAGMEKVADGLTYSLDTTGVPEVVRVFVPDYKVKTEEGVKTGNDNGPNNPKKGSAQLGISTILMVAGIAVLAVIILKNMKKSRRG